MSILKLLRRGMNRYGPKDGCGTGDCGACTVVLGELDDDKIIYKTINACISLLPCLQGKQLITIEDLADGDLLHPVQESIINFHGTQCGFCSPGVVMSLFALIKQTSQPTRKQIVHALSGNLCRCTGYQSIFNAASSLGNIELKDKFERESDKVTARLKEINSHTDLRLSKGDSYCYAPDNIDELARLLEHHPEAQLLAGGTSLLPKSELYSHKFEKLIFIGIITELKSITETDESIILGAAVTISDCVNPLQDEFKDFGTLLMQFGSQQIRNQATLGGHIANASPIGDLLPALMVLGASITLRHGNMRRSLSVEDFIIGRKTTVLKTSEFIQNIIIPKAKSCFELKLFKVSKRQDVDLATISGAFYLQIYNGKIISVRIAFGGMANMPKRAYHCEAALLEQPWNMNTIRQAMDVLEMDFEPISDVRASAAYRLNVARNLLIKCFVEMQANHENTRISDYA